MFSTKALCGFLLLVVVVVIVAVLLVIPVVIKLNYLYRVLGSNPISVYIYIYFISSDFLVYWTNENIIINIHPPGNISCNVLYYKRNLSTFIC